ncbi:hypothetical protein LKR43_11840 [Pusillimonas sp. MFBS29]|uniref:DUF6776 family protein n=1 Tax=Pusillimonas sp. MFBS29 TaxID=2886690 RepID=UPI001D12AF60|nr:DUF6776 family protein [Pusillimonas sp. MFBS29]MCC2597032.1 hypothetical protein [Pusillimonas sp. MFBS29]
MNHKNPAPEGQAVPASSRSAAVLLAVLALLLGLAAGIFGARYWLQTEASREYDTMRQGLQSQLDERDTQLAGALAQVDALTGKLVVEESTRKGLEASLQAAQTELGAARDQLAFFDQLLPPGPKGAVSIRALEVLRLGPSLQYKTLLMRNAPEDSLFSGELQFTASGKQADGKKAKVILEAVLAPGSDETAASEANPENSRLAISFDEFQRSSGLLAIPQGFTPESVTLNVLEGKKVRVSRTVKLPDLPAPE